MSYLLSQLVNGLSLGLVLGLIAVGFVVVFKATGVLNLAHGSVLLLGAYLVAKLHEPLGFWLAAAAGVLGAAAVAALINTLLVRRVAEPNPGTFAILTIGVDILLLTELTREIGNDVLSNGAPWGADVVEFAGVTLPASRAIAAVLAIVLFGVLGLLAARTDWGIGMRAAAADGDTASLMGIRLSRTSATGWALAGAFAAIAGVFLTSFPATGVTPSVSLVALAAIPAWVLGGFDSIPGAIVGGLVIGVAQALAVGYESQLHFLGRGFGEVVPYAVMLLVLLVRPQGLFGGKEAIRV
ncbi:branched-chain amino acid ABC-type transport system, permease component [Saccharomonospora marina XMU15]|uniref:Branched-chain amino acid ABC-type transport system, permease component n=1 Tax=Saccharomonospora marina XMU15 TaxID=882083 RepID=H5WXT2_9PSEU|nr:branched-chain amino acid ABC transporter permease [Saccharomonospora marina]EHR51741.1 branched-chain amino acid ABC-type transport system, permease component [Saccharomonospora marina XMU15]